MTDEQILNALKSCGDRIAICDGCPYEGRNHCSLLAKQDIIERFNTLKAENAALRERLKKAVELPCIKKSLRWAWSLVSGDSVLVENYLVLYMDKDGYVFYEEENSREAAEARLAELKGGKE